MKRNIKSWLVRPADAFMPVSLSASAILGRNTITIDLYLALFAVRILGLSTSSGLRAAFSLQPSIKKVCGSVKTTLIIQLASSMILALLCHLFHSGGLNFDFIAFIGLGLLLNIEHIFYEYLYATGDSRSAALCRAITSILVCAGMLMSSPAAGECRPTYRLEWLLGATLIATAVSAVIAFAIGGRLKGKLNNGVILASPREMPHTLLYPAAACAFTRLFPSIEPSPWAFFAGLMVYELCRTPFRRSPAESRTMNRVLIITTAVSLALQFFRLSIFESIIPSIAPLLSLPDSALMIFIACVCSFAMFGNLSAREK